jgi:geranylgeranyl pyrophosphate synthase
MNEVILKNPEQTYKSAENQAKAYFQTLFEQYQEKTFVKKLIHDFQIWKKNHVFSPIVPFFSKKEAAAPKNHKQYVKWLIKAGQLERYLHRSVSYIFMRDLGKNINEPETQKRINAIVNELSKNLIKETEQTKQMSHIYHKTFDWAKIYQDAKKDGMEVAIIWLIEKLQHVAKLIPDGMDREEAQRKLIKIVAGVLIQEREDMPTDLSPEERSKRLNRAIKLGYAYGLTYPYIDDLLDSNVLSEVEQSRFSDLIRTTIITGKAPELGEWSGKNKSFIEQVYTELCNAFELIQQNQRSETKEKFYEQAYIFFHSQEVDRKKTLANPNYSNEDLFIPIILKSSASRLIVRTILSAPEDKGFDKRIFYYGVYNQLADDLTDMFKDLESGAVTPYTYYYKYHKVRSDLINPFALYWTVIAYLIHNVYQSDDLAREVILNRAINSLKRLKVRVGNKKYKEIMRIFSNFDLQFNKLIQSFVDKAQDVDFYDKLLRDQMIATLKNEELAREDFSKIVKAVRKKINFALLIEKKNEIPNKTIIDAANYSLEGDGKRLRPIITWVMAVKEYALHEEAIFPLLKSLEYMHTASLIFDDLPAQDNATIRRGRPTLHEVYNTAIAELTGLFMTQKAVEEQTNLKNFTSDVVLRLIQYSSETIQKMCVGQAMDLNAKGKHLTLDELNKMCLYKTGIGFEASLVLPAILACVDEKEMDGLKQFAKHAGIAFQIKDDLLDVEGDQHLLGKRIGQDEGNKSSTFVSILGVEEAKKMMWEHYCLADEALQHLPLKTPFLKQLLNYFVHRDH